jgi:hypothetical protein
MSRENGRPINIINEDEIQTEITVNIKKSGKLAPISEETVNRWIEEGVSYFENNPNETYWYVTSGNKIIVMSNDEGMIDITIATPTHHGHTKIESDGIPF